MSNARPFIFGSPNRYIQGANVLSQLGDHIHHFGSRIYLIASKRRFELTQPIFRDNLAKHDLHVDFGEFGGESSIVKIQKHIAAVENIGNVDIVVGIGGGKTIDAARGVAQKCRVRQVIVPTLVSNDGPCSSNSVIYKEDGSYHEHWYYNTNPDLVLVDSLVIAKAPVKFLVAGMGDAMSTYYEARACLKANAPNWLGGTALQCGVAIARLCKEVIFEFAAQAIQDMTTSKSDDSVSPALDKIIEANTLMSGIGFESGGLAVAHSLEFGMTTLPAANKYLHGERVGFCTIVQLLLEGERDEAEKVIKLFKIVGLPYMLEQLSLDAHDTESLEAAADFACQPGQPAKNMPFKVTPKMLVDSMKEADRLGRSMR